MVSSIKVFLEHYVTDSYAAICAIKDFPDLNATRNAIETSDLTDPFEKFMPGLVKNQESEYTANFDATAYAAIKAAKDTEQELAIYFGDAGETQKVYFKGYVDAYIKGAGTNAVVEMGIQIIPTKPISETDYHSGS